MVMVPGEIRSVVYQAVARCRLHRPRRKAFRGSGQSRRPRIPDRGRCIRRVAVDQAGCSRGTGACDSARVWHSGGVLMGCLRAITRLAIIVSIFIAVAMPLCAQESASTGGPGFSQSDSLPADSSISPYVAADNGTGLAPATAGPAPALNASQPAGNSIQIPGTTESVPWSIVVLLTT